MSSIMKVWNHDDPELPKSLKTVVYLMKSTEKEKPDVKPSMLPGERLHDYLKRVGLLCMCRICFRERKEEQMKKNLGIV